MTSPVLNTTARQIIVAAYRAGGIIPSEQGIQPFETERGLEALNFLIKEWQTQDIHLWSKTEAIIPLNVGQSKYLLGPTGDEVGEETGFNCTNLEANQVATDTVLTVFDSTGMTGASDILAVSPTISTQDWTAINSATLSSDGTKLTVTNGAAVAGGAEFTLETENTKRYIVKFDYEKGTSAGATFSIVSGATLATTTLTATTSNVELSFTANLDNVTFRFENTSAVSGETSLALNLNYIETSTGDRIGIELDDKTRQWTNIITVNSSTELRIADGLTSAASDKNIIYTYSTMIDRPLRVLQTRYADRLDRSEIPTNQWSREDYFDQPDKTSEGTVTQWYYSPQLTNGDLRVWQTASNVNNVLRFTFTRPLEISTDLVDSPDIPAEWVSALKWNLAARLAIEFGALSRLQVIKQEAAVTLQNALDYDVERSSMIIQPDRGGR